MKGWIFYLEYGSSEDKRNDNDTGNCVAIKTDPGIKGNSTPLLDKYGSLTCISSIMPIKPNFHVAKGKTSTDHIKRCCKRISEKKARKIHPRLFGALAYETLMKCIDSGETK